MENAITRGGEVAMDLLVESLLGGEFGFGTQKLQKFHAHATVVQISGKVQKKGLAVDGGVFVNGRTKTDVGQPKHLFVIHRTARQIDAVAGNEAQGREVLIDGWNAVRSAKRFSVDDGSSDAVGRTEKRCGVRGISLGQKLADARRADRVSQKRFLREDRGGDVQKFSKKFGSSRASLAVAMVKSANNAAAMAEVVENIFCKRRRRQLADLFKLGEIGVVQPLLAKGVKLVLDA